MDENRKNADHRFLSNVFNIFIDIFKSVSESILVVAGTFVFATLVSAGMLWSYDWPLFIASVGGFIVVGVMLALWYDY